LGLATVFGIVKQSGGGITVKSDVGKGATFEIYLPAAQEVPASRGKSPSQSLDLDGTETILLVEDDVGVRGLAQATLEARGYKVLVAADAGKATEAATGFGGPIHLLLTDVVMPGPSGPALAASLKASRPDMRVLFVSGYSDDAVTSHGILGAGATFLEKPFTPRVLAVKVRQVLETAAAAEKPLPVTA
ncbi:MAG TPA: response regulator, partial [Thermoanaerobaculia bacterium]|nr:response regulator [Thermoanaerobaculia bacterium]